MHSLEEMIGEVFSILLRLLVKSIESISIQNPKFPISVREPVLNPCLQCHTTVG